MKKLKEYLKRIYRLSIRYNNQERLVWKDLKSLHTKENWEAGVYENEKLVETRFSITKKKVTSFYYSIYKSQFICRVKVLDSFPPDLTTDVFVLASHFNNIMNAGKVVVSVQNQTAIYHIEKNILFHFLYPSDIYFQVLSHYNYARDLHWAFQQLIDTEEPPAIIIADFLKKKEYE
jgi:hypothetical protein